MNNIKNVHYCYGCGVCVIACSRRIIEIKLNEDGFYEPVITDESHCTDCGICRKVCAYLHENLSLVDTMVKSYGGWSRDFAVRRKCSSGGVGFEFGRSLIEQGYKVCGARYNAEKCIVEHYIANNVEELIPSVGSKYIQSYTVNGFKNINRKKKYLVTGTPCQIDSFRRYIQYFKVEDNFILLDFFCHGVPSMLLWQKYCDEVEKKTGKIVYASWRNKLTGWHDSWVMSVDGEKNGEKVNWQDPYNMLIKEKQSYYKSNFSQGDMFYSLFLGDVCLGKACYEKCKYKYNRSSADIRIGDMWGKTYQDNVDGVSAVVSFTERGDKKLHECNCQLVEHPFDIVAEGQMRKSPEQTKISYKIFVALRQKTKNIYDVFYILKKYNRKKKLLNCIKYIYIMIFKNDKYSKYPQKG